MIAVVFHRLAAQELRAADSWYRKREAAVAGRFLNAVGAAAVRIGEDPDSLPIERRHFRSVRVRRFPYRLIFERYGADRALVIAVAHTSRRPGYWLRRKAEPPSS
jgi:plasmid stabilization system protein ParE